MEFKNQNLIGLKKKSMLGAIWTFIDIFINKGVYFIATIILARIIGPEEFGLIGMITLFVSIGNTLIDSGMSTSLLRSNDVSSKDYSTVFHTTVFMSVVIYVILYLLAPFISEFYKQPKLISIIRVYCIGFLINSLRSIHNVKLIKELNFKKLTLINLPGNIVSVVIAIYLGYSGFGVWSLVWLFLVNQLITTTIMWFKNNWKPKFEFYPSLFKYHFNFGYKLVLSAQLNTIFENINNVIIGKFYDIKLLGFYDRAYTLNNYPASVLSGIIMKVSLPLFASIKHDTKRLQNAYKIIMQIAFLISACVLGFAALFAKELVYLTLGDEWQPIVPIFRVLSLSFILYPFHSLNINVLSLFGRSDLFLRLEVAKKVILILVLLACFRFGIMGLVWSNVITSFLALFVNTYYSSKFLNYTTSRQILDLFPTILVILLTMAIIFSFSIIIDTSNHLFLLIISIFMGLFTLIVICELIKLSPYIHLKNLVLEQIKK